MDNVFFVVKDFRDINNITEIIKNITIWRMLGHPEKQTVRPSSSLFP